MNIIPKPQKITKFQGEFVFENAVVYFEQSLKQNSDFFVDFLKRIFSVEVAVTDDMEKANICFTTWSESNCYIVECSTASISVRADGGQCCFYAIQTLLQLLEPNADGLPCCQNCMIVDYPKFEYRGFHLDIARHFFGVDVIKGIIQLMAGIKLNKLHLHLTDDQGFRIEIEKFPKLNQISSHRDGSEIRPQGVIDPTPHGGFLKKSEIKEIVEFAAKHYIDVIPEFDIPGHSVALLAAYPEFSCAMQPLKVREKWGISKDLLCAGNEEMYPFVCQILDEIVELFPYEYFHLGGDETPKDRWCNCPKCKEMLDKLQLKNYNDLQSYVINFFTLYLEQKGKKVVCWNDGVNSFSSNSIISQYWKPLTKGLAVADINNGRYSIMSPFFKVYFDYPYSMTPLKTTYKFKPHLIGIKRKNRKYVLGVEGAIWTEHVSTVEKLHFNIMPRMLALAECAWGTNKKFADFKKRALYFCQNYPLGTPFFYNLHSLTKPNIRDIFITMKFAKKDAYIELKNQDAVQKSGNNVT